MTTEPTSPEFRRPSGEPVFVYGTLRIGASNHHRLKGAEWLGTGSVRGKLYKVSWYPGFVPEDGAGRVVGDVYVVSSGLLQELDEFEAVSPGELVGEEYERRRMRVTLAEPVQAQGDEFVREVEAWVWVWRRGIQDLIEVSTGDWLDVERPRQPPWFTGVGCVGVLGVPVVGSLLMEVLSDHASMVLGPASLGVFIMLGGGMSFVFGILAGRRREPGRPLQVLLLTAAVLTFFGGLMLISDGF